MSPYVREIQSGTKFTYQAAIDTISYNWFRIEVQTKTEDSSWNTQWTEDKPLKSGENELSWGLTVPKDTGALTVKIVLKRYTFHIDFQDEPPFDVV